MAKREELLVFGDQSVRSSQAAKDIIWQTRHSRVAAEFLKTTMDAIQCEVSAMNLLERARFGSFDSFLDLAETQIKQQTNDVVISTLLLCVAQLSLAIVHAENDVIFSPTAKPTRTYLLGMCTGLLPAAAVATSKGLSNLLKVAPEIVLISLRLAVEASRRSTQVEQGPGSWAMVVTGTSTQDLEKAMEEFHRLNRIPAHKKAYLSSDSTRSNTISGPPSTLSLLVKSSETMMKVSKIELPIFAAFHARHLQRPCDKNILGTSPLLDAYFIPDHTCLISTSTATNYTGHTLREVLSQILDDCLQLPIHFGKMTDSLIRSVGDGDIRVTAMGPSGLAQTLCRRLSSAGIQVTEVEGPPIITQPQLRDGSGAIAIVGMSGRFPGSDSLEEFWNNLEKGCDIHKHIPKDRFDVKDLSSAQNTEDVTPTPLGAFLDRPGLFDPRFFNISPREALQMDPIQRLLLMSTYEALEMAGYFPNGTPSTKCERIGTFFGQTTDDWREFQSGQDIGLYYVPGGIRSFAPGRLNYHFKWEGPSSSYDAACSSSSVAINAATIALLARECDTAVAGGGNILTGPNMFTGLSQGGFLSKTGGPCKTFDNEADGYSRGEAVGVVVMKRLEDAIADNDNIQGIIRSISTNHSAHAVSITHPHSATQQKLYTRVLHAAGVKPVDIGYIEAHGTGTQAGDSIEMESIVKTFTVKRDENYPLYVGAVKANMGHGEAAAGVTSLIKSLLMLRYKVIPPHCGIKGSINKAFPSLGELNIQIPKSATPFEANPNGDGKRRIMMNNFQAAGGNTSMVLEEPPVRMSTGEDPRPHQIVAISASSLTALDQNKERLLKYLLANPHTRLSDVAYTTTARRMHHSFRTSITVKTTESLISSLQKNLVPTQDQKISKKPSVVFLFTGQSSQYQGMGNELFRTSVLFRAQVEEHDRICVHQGFPSFVQIISNPELDITAMSPVQVQLAIVSLEVALANLWESWGVRPDLVIGHSLGEYAALCIAKVLSVTDMLYLVGRRAELMQQACAPYTHAMLAVQSSREQIQRVLEDGKYPCAIACNNTQLSVVVTGATKGIASLQTRLQQDNIKCTLLEVPYAFHSAQLDPILEDFYRVAECVPYATPATAVASPLYGDMVTTGGVFSASYLVRQARNEVDFVGALLACKSQNIVDKNTLWIENGPQPVCLGMVRATLEIQPKNTLPTLRSSESNWDTLSKAVAGAYNLGAEIMWPDFHKEYTPALSPLELPNYAFDTKNYWIEYQSRRDPLRRDTSHMMESGFTTTCLQRVDSETFTEQEGSVTFVSDASEPRLLAAIQGHLVNGVGLCPSSVYSDMALTAAQYIYSKMEPSKAKPAFNVEHMEVTIPLVVLPDTKEQYIKVTAVKLKSSNTADIIFSSQYRGRSQNHGRCKVKFGDGNAWKAEWARSTHLVQTRIDHVSGTAADRISRPMVYKLFAALVAYTEPYQGLEEVLFDSDNFEAVAKVLFQPSAEEDKFTFSPYWIDSVVHLAGFVLNGNYSTPDDVVYISHGWDHLQFSETLAANKNYMSYVRMQPSGDRGLFVGDVYLLDGETVIAVCSGLRFQRLQKNILHDLLSRASNVSGENTRIQNNRRIRLAVENTDNFVQQEIQNVSISNLAPAEVCSPGKSSPLFTDVLRIMASELGMHASELLDDIQLSDLGIDSLLSISILSKLRTTTFLTLPTSIFNDCSTIADVRIYIQELCNSQSPSASFSSASELSDYSLESVSSEDNIAELLMSILAKEVGLDVSEIEPSSLFSELGVDSLMSITILSKLQSEMGTMLPTSFFNDNLTVSEAYDSLSKDGYADEKEIRPSSTGFAMLSTPRYKCNVVLLQGNPNSPENPLFLIADGAGSAAPYINFPKFQSGLPVYGIESPFLNCPTEFLCTIEEFATMAIVAIRSVKPHGPYILGGWSLGGILAFEIASQLTAASETVKGLIMIDSPKTKPVKGLPQITVEWADKLGMFVPIKRRGKEEEPMPLTQRQLLTQGIKSLASYVHNPIPASKSPGHTAIIWASRSKFEEIGRIVERALEKGVTTGSSIADIECDTSWLYEKKESYGPHGWDELVGGTEAIRCSVVEGNHFSIMNKPQIDETGKLVEEALARISSLS